MKRLKLFEAFLDTVTYEMTGSPKPQWKVKSDFQSYMYSKGFKHTRLNKKTDILITNDKYSNTLKMKKAKDYDIEVYSYQELLEEPERIHRKASLKNKMDRIREIAKD